MTAERWSYIVTPSARRDLRRLDPPIKQRIVAALDRFVADPYAGDIPALAYARGMDAAREFDVVMVAEPEGGYSVFVPELPSVATQGESIEEARANAQEAIEGYLEVMHEDGLPIPTVHRDRVAVHAA